jgi:hypothetical protein
MAEAICWGLPEGCGAESDGACELGDGAGVAAAAARCARSAAARRAAARFAARRAAACLAARSARSRRTSSAASALRAASGGRILSSEWVFAVLAPAIASIDDDITAGADFPADAPEAVKPAATAAGTITVTPAMATVILENFRLSVTGLRCNLWRAGTNHLWSGALCASAPPGALPTGH